MSDLVVHPSNAEAVRSWDNRERSYWVEREEAFDRAMAHLQPRLLAAAAIRPGDRSWTSAAGTVKAPATPRTGPWPVGCAGWTCPR